MFILSVNSWYVYLDGESCWGGWHRLVSREDEDDDDEKGDEVDK